MELFVFWFFVCFGLNSTLISDNNGPNITIEGITIKGFEYLRDYVYGLQPQINSSNIKDVTTMNEQFNVESIQTNILVYDLVSAKNANQILEILVKARSVKTKVCLIEFIYFIYVYPF